MNWIDPSYPMNRICALAPGAISDVDRWNARYPAGTTVTYGLSKSRMAAPRFTVTTSPAFIHNRRPSIFLSGVGCVDLCAVQAIEDDVVGVPI